MDTKSRLAKSFVLTIFCVIVIIGCAPKKAINSQNSSILQSFEVVSDLDLKITETSGLERYNNQLLTHNDSDDTPTVYFLTTTGVIEGSTTFTNMKNVDWEDIAIGENSFFIADVGNNYGDRTDLKLYKIPIATIASPDAQPEEILLSYKAQSVFKRDNQNHSYDGEALVYVNGKLLLFSKDWINFTTDVYRIDENQKNQSLERFQQFDVQGLVTGATSNGNDRIVLCGYNSSLEPFVAVLSVDTGKLKLTERFTLPIVDGAQVEAITYFESTSNEELYYLTSEAVNIRLGEDEATSNGQLYKLTLKK